jgi:hypothetical protein
MSIIFNAVEGEKMEINTIAFEYAVSKIGDGYIFEEFAKLFLSGVYGYSFISVGETKDKGIDAYQHTFHSEKYNTRIFQISTELSWENKIEDTFIKLQKNEIKADQLYYVTNRKLNNAESFSDKMYDKYNISLNIYDIRWFVNHCNENEKTITAYNIFTSTFTRRSKIKLTLSMIFLIIL